MRSMERIQHRLYEGSVFSSCTVFEAKNWPLHTTPRRPWRTTWFHHHSSLHAIAQTSYLANLVQHIYTNKAMKSMFLTSWRDKSRHRPFIELVNWLEIPVKVESSLSYGSRPSCTTIKYAHCVLLAHHVLYYIQAGISDHLNDMSVLSTSHAYWAARRMLRGTRSSR